MPAGVGRPGQARRSAAPAPAGAAHPRGCPRPRPPRRGQRPDRCGLSVVGPGPSAEALPLHQRALRIHEAALGPDHPYVADDLNRRACVVGLARPAEALPLHERALRIMRLRSAPTTPTSPPTSTMSGRRCRHWAGMRRRCPCTSGRCASMRLRSARPPVRRHRPQPCGPGVVGTGPDAEALPLHQRALRIREAALSPNHPYTRQSLRFLVRRVKPDRRRGSLTTAIRSFIAFGSTGLGLGFISGSLCMVVFYSSRFSRPAQTSLTMKEFICGEEGC